MSSYCGFIALRVCNNTWDQEGFLNQCYTQCLGTGGGVFL